MPFNRAFLPLVLILCIALFAATGCARRAQNRLGGQSNVVTIKGSDTMVHLVSTLAEAYMRQHPEIMISVTGGGSGTGVAALINQTTDIAALSRSLKPEELEAAKKRQVTPQEITVARDGIAVVVNPQNPIRELTLAQVKDIFTGKTTQWKALGGSKTPVLAFSRESSSGTYVFFQEHVMDSEDYAKNVRLMTSSATIVEAVATDAGSIGYVGLGYLQPNKVQAVAIRKDPSAPAVLPTEANIVSGEYAISRPLFLYSNQQPPAQVKAFIQFCLSPAGQKIVRETGFVAI